MQNNQMQEVAATYPNAVKHLKYTAAISMLLAPMLTFLGWALSHDSIGSFLHLTFTWVANDATVNLTATSDPSLIFRYYLLPHYFIYASMPVYIGLSLALSNVLFKRAPWHSFLGVILSILGAVYFIGVLGAFLSAPIGSVQMTPILQISFGLCLLVFIGNIIQGFGLLQSKIIPKWAAVCFIIGNILILAFPGVENWMAIGSLLMIPGLTPLACKYLRKQL